MIIFTTDNGNFHSEHGMAEKWFPHEESIRVPLIVLDPRMDRGKAGMVNDDFTLNVDLAPTILSVSSMHPHKDWVFGFGSVVY
jgi:arylsulfatase